MEHNKKDICKTVISREEENLNKQMTELKIYLFFQYFITFWSNWILFQGLETYSAIKCFFNTFNTAWESCIGLFIYSNLPQTPMICLGLWEIEMCEA